MKLGDYLISTMVFILLTACGYGILNKKNDNIVENYCSEKYLRKIKKKFSYQRLSYRK